MLKYIFKYKKTAIRAVFEQIDVKNKLNYRHLFVYGSVGLPLDCSVGLGSVGLGIMWILE